MTSARETNKIVLITITNFVKLCKSTIKVWKTIKNSTGLQSDPAGIVIILSNKKLITDVDKILNRSLDFVPTIQKVNQMKKNSMKK